MMKSLFIHCFVFFFSVVCFVSCGDRPTESGLQSSQDEDSIATIRPTNDRILDSVSTTVSADETKTPSALLMEFTNYLDSIGYAYDTVRIKKIPYFNGHLSIYDDEFMNGDKLFYKLTPEKTMLFRCKERIAALTGVDTSSIHYELFARVRSITGYFYCEKKAEKDFVYDGAIEEWTFASVKEADEAGMEINRFKFVVYFHTGAYIARQKNKLYICHNRASFEFIYKKVLKRFEKKLDVIYPFKTTPENDKISTSDKK
jgi:hypothetical protein